MSRKIEAVANCKDAFILWRSNKLIPDCTGFELHRIQNGKSTVVDNRVDFSCD